ncbi:MAG TPA: HAD-IIA family hydrolase [Limnochordia bacterium]
MSVPAPSPVEAADLLALQGFLFDLDGTIYLGERLIPGAAEAIERLRAAGRRVRFVSNKPIETREAYAAKLSRLGIPTAAAEVINSSYVLTRYLARTCPGARVFVLGEPPFLEELRRAGLRVIADPKACGYAVDVVVAAMDRTLDYTKLDHALQCLKRGARLVATNPDPTCPVEGGEIPDCGATLAAIEAMTGLRPEAVAGKPGPLMAEVAVAEMDLPPAACVAVGDRLTTDIAFAKAAGLRSALVLSGVTRREDIERIGIIPDFVLESVAEIAAAFSAAPKRPPEAEPPSDRERT